MANLGFNPEEYGEMDDFSPLPEGNYNVVISDSRIKQNRSGEDMVVMTFTVLDGDERGRTIKNFYGIHSANEVARRINRQEIKSIIVACGLQSAVDTQQLHSIPLTIKVAVESYVPSGATSADDKRYTNRIKGYYKHGSVSTAPATNGGQPPLTEQSGSAGPSPFA